MKKKIVIHCQYVYGIGHFVRVIELATALVEKFEVHVLNGGQVITGFPVCTAINIINIPSIYKDENSNRLLPVDEGISLEQCFDKRFEAIGRALENIKADIIITEHFPFGFLFKDEALFYINKAKIVNPSVRVVSSVRDVIENALGNQNDTITVDILNEYYDLLLIHGDQDIIGLKDSFPLYDAIKIDKIHTGYVVKKMERKTFTNGIAKILVSIGAGRLGVELLQKIYKSLDFFDKEQYKLVLFTGIFQEDAQGFRDRLQSPESRNVQIFEFDRDRYLSELNSCDLVISLGGYNSILEAVSLKKRMLVYNRVFLGNNLEQDIRIQKFKENGFLHTFNVDIESERLAELIKRTVHSEYKFDFEINLHGATNTFDAINSLV